MAGWVFPPFTLVRKHILLSLSSLFANGQTALGWRATAISDWQTLSGNSFTNNLRNDQIWTFLSVLPFMMLIYYNSDQVWHKKCYFFVMFQMYESNLCCLITCNNYYHFSCVSPVFCLSGGSSGDILKSRTLHCEYLVSCLAKKKRYLLYISAGIGGGADIGR